MKSLIVEDDFISRRVLQEILSPYGTSDTAVNGVEALQALKIAQDEGHAYDLICLDIMMPVMNGQEVLKKVREYELSIGRLGLERAKIIMITALKDFDNIMTAFVEECEAYLVKPLEKQKLLQILESLDLI